MIINVIDKLIIEYLDEKFIFVIVIFLLVDLFK